MDKEFTRFRCHTGHAFTARHLAAGLQEAEEKALRVMEERVRMLRRLAKKNAERGHKLSQTAFSERADEAEEHVRSLRELLSGAHNLQD